MKVIISILVIALLSYLTGLFLPWWTIALVAFVVVFFVKLPSFQAFVSGFVAVCLLWFILSFALSADNNHGLATKMAGVILNVSNPFILMIVTGITGGIVAGLSALTASYFRPRPFVKITH